MGRYNNFYFNICIYTLSSWSRKLFPKVERVCNYRGGNFDWKKVGVIVEQDVIMEKFYKIWNQGKIQSVINTILKINYYGETKQGSKIYTNDIKQNDYYSLPHQRIIVDDIVDVTELESKSFRLFYNLIEKGKNKKYIEKSIFNFLRKFYTKKNNDIAKAEYNRDLTEKAFKISKKYFLSNEENSIIIYSLHYGKTERKRILDKKIITEIIEKYGRKDNTIDYQKLCKALANVLHEIILYDFILKENIKNLIPAKRKFSELIGKFKKINFTEYRGMEKLNQIIMIIDYFEKGQLESRRQLKRILDNKIRYNIDEKLSILNSKLFPQKIIKIILNIKNNDINKNNIYDYYNLEKSRVKYRELYIFLCSLLQLEY